ncbi:hypothetical protein [Streptomyces indiaensis]|uniref:hypothetical protein n=1 Tax=Streptomyces indiaensis TaxID=284033 RepID=UPI00355617A2
MAVHLHEHATRRWRSGSRAAPSISPGPVVPVGEEEIVLVVPFDDRFAGRTSVTLPEPAADRRGGAVRRPAADGLAAAC